MYLVYIHTNKLNGKRYIGITSRNPNERWHNGSGYSNKLPIGKAIQKYGWDNFTHEIIADNLSADDAKAMERALIEKYQTRDDRYGYNITKGGDGVCGWHPSEETKQKISKSREGRFYGAENPNFGHRWTDEMKADASERMKAVMSSQETRKKRSDSAKKKVGELNPFYGKRHTDETKKKISASRQGRFCGAENPNFGHKWTDEMKAAARERAKDRKLSDEARKRMSEKRVGKLNAFYGRHHTEETKNLISQANSKQVDMFDKEGILIQTFSSIKSAAEAMKQSSTSIVNCCKGKTKTSGGYIWKYK